MLSKELEKAMAPHSSTLEWRIPWTEEPSGLRSVGSRRVGHDWATLLSLFTFLHRRRKWQPTPVFLLATHSSVLAWRIPGMGEPGGLPSMGSHRVGHDWSDLAAAAAAETSNYIKMMNLLKVTLLFMAYLIAQLVKNLPAMPETPVRFLGQEELLEKG